MRLRALMPSTELYRASPLGPGMSELEAFRHSSDTNQVVWPRSAGTGLDTGWAARPLLPPLAGAVLLRRGASV
jgi:hypothetical protein